MKIETVTIVGANGNMGKNVAGIVASFGDCTVYLISRSKADSKAAVDAICRSVKSDAIKDNLIPRDYSSLKDCVNKSDWVFESVAENMEIKKKVTQEIFLSVNPKTLVTTGTSGLSITEIAKSISEEKSKNYFGTHFFNPPYNLNLCEVIDTEFSSNDVVKTFSEFLEKKLLRTVVYVKDTPAFLANRIGFQFINKAFWLAEENKEIGGIDYIDYVFQGITGRSMSPLKTADFVGLDVHKAIIDNLYHNTTDYCNEYFNTPNFLKELLDKKLLGQKCGEGLYKSKEIDGRKARKVYDILQKDYRDERNYSIPVIEEMKSLISNGKYMDSYAMLLNDDSKEAKMITDMLTDYVVYSAFVSSETSENISSADDAMANGFNWIPPQCLFELLGGQENFEECYYKNLGNKITHQEYARLMKEMQKSNYDFRKYIKG